MESSMKKFVAVDYVVFAVLLLISAGIGIFYACWGGRQKTTGEFLMGNRHMHVLPVAVSMLLSFMSAISVIGVPAEMYTKGTEFYLSSVGMSLGAVMAAVLFVPLLYPLKITSSFEYLEKRFNSRAAKVTGTIIMILQQVLYMGMVSYAPSTALEAVTGFPTWASIITIGLVSTFYTTLGGMKAVVWTDFFQALVMVAGLLAILILGSINVGGMAQVWRLNEEWGRIHFFDFNPDPTVRHTFWSVVVGNMVIWMSLFGVNQAGVQRFCALPTLKKAKWSVLLNVAGIMIFVTILCLLGVTVFAYYARTGCEPLSAKHISNPNQLIPYFVMDVIGYPGVPGLFISCLFSGALSSMSSCLNSLSAICWEDFLKSHLEDKLTEGQKTLVTKFLDTAGVFLLLTSFFTPVFVIVLLFGGAGIGTGFMVENMGGTILQVSLSFAGGVCGPLLGIFVLGAFFPWANWIGAVVGGILGLVMTMWICIGAYSVKRPPAVLKYPNFNCSIPNSTDVAATLLYGNTTYTTTGLTGNLTQITTGLTDNLTQTTTGLTGNSTPIPQYTGLSALYTVSYLWYPSIGVATVVIVGLIVSAITGMNRVGDVDTKYLIPVFDRLFCCLPDFISRPLRCYQDFESPEKICAEEGEEKSYIPMKKTHLSEYTDSTNK